MNMGAWVESEFSSFLHNVALVFYEWVGVVIPNISLF